MKKFRFQLLAKWIIDNYPKCKVADIGGGKGLLTYLLNKAGFDAVVIDPVSQSLNKRYKTLDGQKILIPEDKRIVPRISREFSEEMTNGFDLLVSMHAHGSNMFIINSTKKYSKDFIIFPCCVIDEPIEIRPDINWFKSLIGYSHNIGHRVKITRLNFRGQNKGIYTVGNLVKD